jgi:hypothetical protein
MLGFWVTRSIRRRGWPGFLEVAAHRGSESAKVVLRERLEPHQRSFPMRTERNLDLSGFAPVEDRGIVAQIRRRWPKTRILLRADSGFAREALMAC